MTRITVRAKLLHHPLLAPVAINLADGISPDEAGVIAAVNNAGLRAVRDARGEATAQLIAAGLLPNPVLTGELDRAKGTTTERTVNQYSFSLEQSLGGLITRGAKKAAARATLASVDLGIAWQEWQVAQAARLAAVRVVMLGRRLAILRSEADFEQETVATLQRAIQSGDATVGDLGVHRSALEGVRQRAGDTARALAKSRARLNLLLGFPPDARIPAVLPPDAGLRFGALLPVDALVGRAVTARLDLEALRLGYTAEEARVRQAVLAQFPSISIGIVRQRNETAVQFLGGFVSLGLPIFDRNQGRIALERATRTRLRHEYEARIARVRSNVAGLVSTDRLLARQIAEARSGVASLEKVEKAEHAGVLSGDVSRLAWQDVRSSLLDTRLKLAALVQARLETRIALATATGSEKTVASGSVAPAGSPEAGRFESPGPHASPSVACTAGCTALVAGRNGVR
ncbi:MAG: TolC family protein [Acidobacteria bacterium]|nr:TolC family protein [Acidobacteriota bacterium]